MNSVQKIKVSKRGLILLTLMTMSTVVACSYIGSLIALLAGDDIMKARLFSVGNWSWLVLITVCIVLVLFVNSERDEHRRQRSKRLRKRRAREKRGYPRPNIQPPQPSPTKPKATLRRVK